LDDEWRARKLLKKPNQSTLAFWPSARQQAAPLAAGHQRSSCLCGQPA